MGKNSFNIVRLDVVCATTKDDRRVILKINVLKKRSDVLNLSPPLTDDVGVPHTTNERNQGVPDDNSSSHAAVSKRGQSIR